MRLSGGLLAVLLAAGVFIAPAGASPSGGARETPVTAQQAQQAVTEAATRARNNDGAGIISTLAPITQTPAFASLPDNYKYLGYFLLGAAYYDRGDFEHALPAARQSTQFTAFASALDWQIRFWSAFRMHEREDAVASYETLAARWPASTHDYTEDTINWVSVDLRSDGTADQRYRFLIALRQSGWRSSNVFSDPDYRWRELVRMHLARGHIDEARAVAHDITAPAVLAMMMVDRRYDRLGLDASSMDWAAAFARYLEARRALAAEHADLLDGVRDVAQAELSLGLAQEALSRVDAAIDRAESPVAEGRRFTDQADAINWIYNWRSAALKHLGRDDEAVQALARGARRPEHGNTNVSQLINLGELLLRVGRPQEALEQIADFDEAAASPYGWMNASYVRACAYHEMGDAAHADQVLAQMRARAADSRRIMVAAELCFGREDEAARMYVASLEDEDDRETALLDAQNWMPTPSLTAFEQRIENGTRAILSRPEVRQAVERYGRVLTLPVLRSPL